MLACYDEQAHGYRLEVEAPYADYPSGDPMAGYPPHERQRGAPALPPPGQYMWFLKIFDTREDQVGPDGLYEEGIRRIRRGLALTLGALRSPGAKMWPQAGHLFLTCLIEVTLARGAVQGRVEKSCQDH